MEKKSWTRVEVLTAAGVAIALVAAILSLLNPEIRQLTGLGGFYDSKPQPLPTRLSESNLADSINGVVPSSPDQPVEPKVLETSIVFAPRIDVPTEAEPLGIAASDFDGDGLLDLAVAIYASSHVAVFRNIGSIGAPAFGSPYQVSVGLGPQGVAAADLDADGRSDLVSANAGDDSVSTLRNVSTRGSIRFELVSRLSLRTPHRVAIADMDSDGMLDLVVTSNSSMAAAVFRHSPPSGELTFEAPIFLAAPNFLNHLSLADLDGDGDVDLLVPLIDSHRLAIYYNVSVPGRVEMTDPYLLNTNAFPDTVGTIPLGDWISPIVVVGSRGAAGVSLYVRSSNHYATVSTLWTGDSPSAVRSGDFDRDGRADLAVANLGSSTVTVIRNVTSSEALAFSTLHPTLRTGGSPVDLLLQDLDEDGFLDIITSNHRGFGVSIFMNMSEQ